MFTHDKPWPCDLDRAVFLLGALGREDATHIVTDAGDLAAFCETHRLSLDECEVAELKAVLRV